MRFSATRSANWTSYTVHKKVICLDSKLTATSNSKTSYQSVKWNDAAMQSLKCLDLSAVRFSLCLKALIMLCIWRNTILKWAKLDKLCRDLTESRRLKIRFCCRKLCSVGFHIVSLAHVSRNLVIQSHFSTMSWVLLTHQDGKLDCCKSCST